MPACRGLRANPLRPQDWQMSSATHSSRATRSYFKSMHKHSDGSKCHIGNDKSDGKGIYNADLKDN